MFENTINFIQDIYQNQDFMFEFVTTLNEVLCDLNLEFEIILVNDGSTDNSWDIMMDLVRSNQNLVCVDLSRNSGQHRAVLVGLRQSKGDLVIVMDSDMEEDPRLIKQLVELNAKTESVVMVTRSSSKKSGLIYKLSRKL